MAYSFPEPERVHYKISCKSCGYRNREDCFIALDKRECRPYLNCPRCKNDPLRVLVVSKIRPRANPHHGDSTYHPNPKIEQSRIPLDPPNGPFRGRLTIQDLPGVQAVYDKYTKVSEQDEN